MTKYDMQFFPILLKDCTVPFNSRQRKYQEMRLLNRGKPPLKFNFLIIIILFLPIQAQSAVSEDTQRNAFCYIKNNAPDLVQGEAPFSCHGRPELFVSSVANELLFISTTNLIDRFNECQPHIFEKDNLIFIARGVWDMRDSPIQSSKAAIAFSIKNTCKFILKE